MDNSTIDYKRDGTWLVFRRTIETEMRQGAAQKAVLEYLDAIDFRQMPATGVLVFQRGASLAGFYHPNPKALKTEIAVDVLNTGGASLIEVTMRVNRLGAIPLASDFEFWQAELDGLSQSLHFGFADPRTSQFAAERAFWHGMSIILGVTLTALLLMLCLLPMIISFVTT